MPHQVVLNWQESSPNDPAVSFNVYRGTALTGPFTKINTSPVTSPTFTDTQVTSGQQYWYEVTAVDANGIESADSSIASATVPGPNAPTGLTATAS